MEISEFFKVMQFKVAFHGNCKDVSPHIMPNDVWLLLSIDVYVL